jgi:hypothetical protein
MKSSLEIAREIAEKVHLEPNEKYPKGPMPFLHTVDADMVAYRQGRTRKGNYF